MAKVKLSPKQKEDITKAIIGNIMVIEPALITGKHQHSNLLALDQLKEDIIRIVNA